MIPSLFAAIGQQQFWHIVPLIIAISLVYGATRHELMQPILVNAFKFGVWIITFMGVIFGIIFVIASRL